MVVAGSIRFVRHDGEIRSTETDRPLRHPAHPCNTLSSGATVTLITHHYCTLIRLIPPDEGSDWSDGLEGRTTSERPVVPTENVITPPEHFHLRKYLARIAVSAGTREGVTSLSHLYITLYASHSSSDTWPHPTTGSFPNAMLVR